MRNRPPPATVSQPGHPISVVAQRTGLSRDVLRVWERRYGAVEPKRTSGGQRLYSNDEIARFRLLAAATRRGRNISMVAGLSTEALERLVAEDEAQGQTSAPLLDGVNAEAAAAALEHTRALDAFALDRELRRAIARHGIPALIEDVVPALMRRVGDEWQAGRLTIAHEHLASAVVIAILHEAMRSMPESPGASRLLVATPAGERHAIGSALAAAGARLEGWSIVDLGVDVPAADLVAAVAASGARAVALSVVYADHPDRVIGDLHAVRDALAPHIPVIVGGAATIRMAGRLEGPGLLVCGSIAEMRHLLPRDQAGS